MCYHSDQSHFLNSIFILPWGIFWAWHIILFETKESKDKKWLQAETKWSINAKMRPFSVTIPTRAVADITFPNIANWQRLHNLPLLQTSHYWSKICSVVAFSSLRVFCRPCSQRLKFWLTTNDYSFFLYNLLGYTS